MTYTIQELTPALIQSQTQDYFATLANLSSVDTMTTEDAAVTLSLINQQWSHVYVAIHDDGKIVGTITLLVEQKFLRWWALAGHLEDVAVREGYEGQGIGGWLVAHAVAEAKKLGCYKIILDCNEKLLWFYAKYGFEAKEVCMKMYL
jgi:glucosamine-phosphate N-acetyltransferase